MDHPVLADLVKSPATEFVAKYLFDRVPHVFSDRDQFVRCKALLGKHLEVDPASLFLVGSAAIGVSLNPDKNFKGFDETSDVDVAVVSHYHFTVAWRYLRNNSERRLTLTTRQRIAWDDHVKRLVYWGAIATDKLLPLMPFASPWMRASTEAAKVAPLQKREIKFRIYSDIESLRTYQVNSTRRAQGILLER